MSKHRTVKIDADVWDMIVSHYAALDPSHIDNDTSIVMRYITEKEYSRMRHDDFTEAKARFARMRDWESRC